MDEEIKPHRSLKEILPKKNGRSITTASRVKAAAVPKEFASRLGVGLPSQRRAPRGINLTVFGWLVIGLAVIAGVYYGGLYWGSVKVTVTPKTASFTVDGDYFAKAAPAADELGFGRISKITGNEQVSLSATKVKGLPTKAKGTVAIYNTSKQSQALVATTRLQTKDGKIYRIDKFVTVPPVKQVNGKDLAGSVIVEATADQAGPDYNIDLTDFSIPGLKGKPAYDLIYGRSKTTMTGGGNGENWKIDEAAKVKARAELEQRLTSKLTEAARAEIPDDFILYDNASAVAYTETINADPKKEGQVIFKLDGTLTGVLFQREDLAAYLAEKFVADYQTGDKVEIKNINDLKLALDDKTASSDAINFSLAGQANLVWQVDTENLRASLKNMAKGDYQAVFTDFPNIARATVNFRPPWLSRFPADPNQITILVK